MIQAKKGNHTLRKYSDAPGSFPIKGRGGVTERQTAQTNGFTMHCTQPMKRWLECYPEAVDMESKKLVRKGCEVKRVSKGSQPCFKRIHYLQPR